MQHNFLEPEELILIVWMLQVIHLARPPTLGAHSHSASRRTLPSPARAPLPSLSTSVWPFHSTPTHIIPPSLPSPPSLPLFFVPPSLSCLPAPLFGCLPASLPSQPPCLTHPFMLFYHPSPPLPCYLLASPRSASAHPRAPLPPGYRNKPMRATKPRALPNVCWRMEGRGRARDVINIIVHLHHIHYHHHALHPHHHHHPRHYHHRHHHHP